MGHFPHELVGSIGGGLLAARDRRPFELGGDGSPFRRIASSLVDRAGARRHLAKEEQGEPDGRDLGEQTTHGPFGQL